MCLRENFDFFWLDAICIDQSDIQERNHQVQIMHTIYSSSEVVYIWLGESQSDSELLRAITCVKNWHKLRLILRADSFRIELLCHLMQSLCHHEYWGRMWIIQEVFYAKPAIIHYGSSDIDISVLDELAVEAYGVHNHDPFNGIVGSFLTTPAAKILELRRSGQPASLFDLLVKFRNHETTEFRDKVYALHGMCEQASQIMVDYLLTKEELFLRVMDWTGTENIDVVFSRIVAQTLKLEWSEAIVPLLQDKVTARRTGRKTAAADTWA
jgi:hypothetical protein